MSFKYPISKFTIFLKFLVSGGLLSYIFYFSGIVDIQEVINILKQTKLSLFTVAIVICVISVFISAKRWSLFLLEAIKYTRLVSLYFIGSFFNTFFPGHVGGEIVKTFYLYKDTGKGVSSIASVFMDRYMGFTAMVLVSLIAFIGGYSYFKDTGIELLIPAVGIVFLIVSIIFWGTNWGKINILSAFYTPLIEYKTRRGIIFKGLTLSIILQLIGITEVYLFSLAIGLKVPVIYFFIFVPIVNAISAIPISVAGLGIRETGFAALFNMVFKKVGVTSNEAISLSMLLFIAICLFNLIGVVEYLRIKKTFSYG